MTRGETELIAPGAKFLVLGLALLFLGRQEDVDATLEVRAVCNPRDTPASSHATTAVGQRLLMYWNVYN